MSALHRNAYVTSEVDSFWSDALYPPSKVPPEIQQKTTESAQARLKKLRSFCTDPNAYPTEFPHLSKPPVEFSVVTPFHHALRKAWISSCDIKLKKYSELRYREFRNYVRKRKTMALRPQLTESENDLFSESKETKQDTEGRDIDRFRQIVFVDKANIRPEDLEGNSLMSTYKQLVQIDTVMEYGQERLDKLNKENKMRYTLGKVDEIVPSWFEVIEAAAINAIGALDVLLRLDGLDEFKNYLYSCVTTFINDPIVSANQYINFMLMGPSGVGKTTAAAAVAGVLKAFGLYIVGDFVVHQPSEYKGQYTGWTAPKVLNNLYTNLECITLIDEAYVLATKGNTSEWSADSIEAFGAIVKFMDDCKGLYCVMVAGYEKNMREDFLGVNTGLTRRFGFQITLPSYQPATLTHIFFKQLEKLSPSGHRWPLYVGKLLQMYITYSRLPSLKRNMSLFDKQAGDLTNMAEDAMQYTSSYKPGQELMEITDMTHLVRSYVLKHKPDLADALTEDTANDNINRLFQLAEKKHADEAEKDQDDDEL